MRHCRGGSVVIARHPCNYVAVTSKVSVGAPVAGGQGTPHPPLEVLLAMQRFSARAAKAARKRSGKSREQVAVDVGRSHETITSYELGRTSPPACVLGPLADSLGVHVGELFEDEQL